MKRAFSASDQINDVFRSAGDQLLDKILHGCANAVEGVGLDEVIGTKITFPTTIKAPIVVIGIPGFRMIAFGMNDFF